MLSVQDFLAISSPIASFDTALVTQPPIIVHSVEITGQSTDSQVTKHGHLNKKGNNVTDFFSAPEWGLAGLQSFLNTRIQRFTSLLLVREEKLLKR